MIIGSGLIGKIFKTNEKKFDDCIVFASGVSNSRLQDDKEFKKEFDLIKNYVTDKRKFIYFSSIHVLDPSENNSMYAKHKIEIEDFIKNNFESFIIYRLPIIVGKGGNSLSLFNFLNDSVKNEKEINVFLYSCRYIMDVDSVVYFVYKTLHRDKIIINLVFDKSFKIIDIVNSFEKFYHKKALCIFSEKGNKFDVDNSEFKKSMPLYNFTKYNNKSYIEYVINKYYKV